MVFSRRVVDGVSARAAGEYVIPRTRRLLPARYGNARGVDEQGRIVVAGKHPAGQITIELICANDACPRPDAQRTAGWQDGL